ncbi:EF-hand [Exidia glandulosa HHB12029]|uniref:EF-hand n=1 Tax=Exidia glandulosa HHB12029 TaxID=1314781 RepID=A0A165CJ38_EXIGL|nr:EF-hand [Exidia glandulosa HHB12029]
MLSSRPSGRTPSPNPAASQQQQQYAHRPSYSSGHHQPPYQQQQQYQHHQTPPPNYAGQSAVANSGAGGFQPHRRTGPPPGADPTLWAWFSAVDADGSGSISATELQQALVNGNWTAFDLDTMLMTIFDTDRSGTIGFNEFAGLWKYIADWQNVFRHFDRDRSGNIDHSELSAALASFGYHLSPRTIQGIADKYSSLPGTSAYGAAPGITFDRFVRACVVVKTLTESFQGLDTDRDGIVAMSYDQFMRVALSAP